MISIIDNDGYRVLLKDGKHYMLVGEGTVVKVIDGKVYDNKSKKEININGKHIIELSPKEVKAYGIK